MSSLLSSQVRACGRGVVVLLTAGCTWDDVVLAGLRTAARHRKPLVLVHCVTSCPLPTLEEWCVQLLRRLLARTLALAT